jgi:hypothetical protein
MTGRLRLELATLRERTAPATRDVARQCPARHPGHDALGGGCGPPTGDAPRTASWQRLLDDFAVPQTV